MSENEVSTMLKNHIEKRKGCARYQNTLKRLEKNTQEEISLLNDLGANTKSTESKLDYIRKLQEENKADVIESEAAIIELINKLNNYSYCCVLTQRYINLLSWEELARAELLSLSSVHRLHSQAIHELETISA